MRDVTVLLCLQCGLFERHKLLFALMLTNKILVSAGKVKAVDVDVLLKGGGALDIASVSIRITTDGCQSGGNGPLRNTHYVQSCVAFWER
jgi:hypothetical protein